jgi:hypothetical protein
MDTIVVIKCTLLTLSCDKVTIYKKTCTLSILYVCVLLMYCTISASYEEMRHLCTVPALVDCS